MMMFFGTGILGIVIGLTIAPSLSSESSLMITFMGVINLSLGAFFGWIFLTQQPTEKDPRKRKPKK
jgi:O-antigen ligase